MGLWSILAAIYHLGYAGVKQGHHLFLIYSSIYLFIHLFIHPSIHLSIHLSIYPSIYPFIPTSGSGRVTERFINPAAAIRAANVLGIQHEELAKDIFNPPRSTTRMSSFLASSASPTISETSSVNLSISSFNISPGSVRANRSFSLDAFVMGLFEHAMYLLLLLINRYPLSPHNHYYFQEN